MKNRLHIVSFDVPFPPDYGGVIDVFHKLRALSELGMEIRLHAFTYGRKENPELEKYCQEVYYYERNDHWQAGLSLLPFIVASRKSDTLLQRLTEWPAPVLFEGLHSTWPLKKGLPANIRTMVRAHNVEDRYYSGLFKSESHLIRKLYFLLESYKLKRYESVLQRTDHILCISRSEQAYFKKKFGDKAVYLPAFHGNATIRQLKGKGYFALFHGNLQVADNRKAAKYLIEAFEGLEYPLVIAGRDPDGSILRAAGRIKNIRFVTIDDPSQLEDLFRRAHIHILMSFQSTGIKLKLINALFQGRFCLVNSEMTKGSNLEALCVHANDVYQIQRKVRELMETDFTEEEIEKRMELLKEFNNKANAAIISELLQV